MSNTLGGSTLALREPFFTQSFAELPRAATGRAALLPWADRAKDGGPPRGYVSSSLATTLVSIFAAGSPSGRLGRVVRSTEP
jgi:hypothetical protein